jgi:hypothetical protein
MFKKPLQLILVIHGFHFAVNNCMNMGKKTPSFMSPAHPGDLLQIISKPAQPPALAPMPLLTESDVSEPPLPAARLNNASTAPAPSPACRMQTHVPILVTLAALCAGVLL